jgi:filamentous hemagglutinin family protein
MIAKSWFGRCWRWQIGGCVAIIGVLCVAVNDRVLAQIVPDNTLGAEGSAVTPDVIKGISSDRIDGGATRGANLFHSFSDFNVREGRGAYFVNSAGIENILTRVTGGNPSNIFGRLGVLGGANLLLLNPNGLIFGANSSLDIQGSFLASTANSFTFPDGSEFSATNPQARPLLAISVPLGLQYGSNPGSVQVQGSSLQVNPGKTLALVGGGVSMDGGQLTAQGGRIELGGVTGTGTVELSADRTGNLLSLSFPNGLARADVSFINQAKVDVTAPGGGSIAINAGNVNIFGRSRLTAGISQNAGSVGIVADDITVDATGTVTLRESSVIQNIVNTGGTGNAGNVNLAAGSLYLISGSQLFTSSFGQGNAGRVNVNVSDTVSIDSAGDNASTSGIISSVAETGIGKGGDINITTGSLSVTNGAQLNSITFNQGDAGNVTINARDTVSFDGANVGATGILSAVAPTGVGQGGDINITSGSLLLTNGAQLNAITRGRGNAGNVTLNVRDTISLDGENPNSVVDPYAGVTSIFTSVSIDDNGNQAIGNGGDINITTGVLSLTNGAQLNAITRGQGDAGNVIINALDTISLDGERQKSSTRAASAIFTSVDSNEYSGYPNLGPAIGNGGDIHITTGLLSITRGAALSALTKGQGDAGNVTINVGDTILIDGENSNQGSSGIFSSVADNLYTGQPPAVGDGGDITITTGLLSITEGGGLFANTRGQGNGGDVIINARDTVSIDGEKKSNRAASGIFSSVGDEIDFPPTRGNGGDIYITTGSLSITRGAGVFANTAAQGNAGHVTINAHDTVSIDGENSNGGSSGVYTSVAKNGIGDGGDINITTGSLSITRGAGVFANTAATGNAGNLSVTALQAVTLSGNSQLLVETTGDGASGDLMIETGRLTVTDEASVSSSTSSSNPDGVGGKLIVNATQSLDLNNGARLLAQSNDTAAAAGSIQISTGNLTAKNGTIATSATKSAGGAITITAGDIRLFGDSDIISNVASGADNGGNINLTADSILAFDDSDILAFARDGRGGDITLNTRVFFGENYRPAPKGTDPNTLENNNQVDVNASGAVNGVITTPDVSFIQNSLTELPENQIDTDSLLANSCIVRRNQPPQGSFTITGTGGFPQRPGDAQMSTFPTVDIETLPNDSTPTNTNPNRPWQKGDPIVEPQGVYRLPNGKLVMSRECSHIQ